MHNGVRGTHGFACLRYKSSSQNTHIVFKETDFLTNIGNMKYHIWRPTPHKIVIHIYIFVLKTNESDLNVNNRQPSANLYLPMNSLIKHICTWTICVCGYRYGASCVYDPLWPCTAIECAVVEWIISDLQKGKSLYNNQVFSWCSAASTKTSWYSMYFLFSGETSIV